MSNHDLHAVMRRVWSGDSTNAGTQALREALVQCALQFCHENSPASQYYDFVAETIREFISPCYDCLPGVPCECICHKEGIIIHDQACCDSCLTCDLRTVPDR